MLPSQRATPLALIEAVAEHKAEAMRPLAALAPAMNKLCLIVSRGVLCPRSTWWSWPTQQVQRAGVGSHTRGQWRVNSGATPTGSKAAVHL